ncbi:MAG: aminopeptidase [Candidatus Thorarchaeota archaeon]
MEIPSFIKRIVKESLGIKEKENVIIQTYKHTLDMAEQFALACRSSKARTHILVDTDDLLYNLTIDTPIEYLKKPDPLESHLYDIPITSINLGGPEDPTRLAKISPERMEAWSRGSEAVYQKMLEKKPKAVYLSLGQITPQRAKSYGFDYDSWMKNSMDALDVDYKTLSDSGNRLIDVIKSGVEMVISSGNDTHMTVSIKDSTTANYDGVYGDESRGTAFILPAGYVTIVPQGGSGKFVSDVPWGQMSVLIHEISFSFEDGTLKSFDGGKNINVIKDIWDKASGRKDRLGYIIIGTNPAAKPGYLNNELVAGCVTVGVGDNRWIGGDIEASGNWQGSLTKAKVEIDGRVIIEDGKMKL